MRFPVNFLLYLTSVGLLGQAGYHFYQASPKLGAPQPQKYWDQGQTEAQKLLKQGKSKGGSAANWSYLNQEWWGKFKDVNFTGKLPPPPKDPLGDGDKPPAVPEPVQTPLENIIELITLVYDGHSNGTAGTTQIVVRYKPEAQVEPPAEEVRRRELIRGGGVAGSGPMDVASNPPPQAGREMGGRRGGRSGPVTPLPASTPSSNEWIQTLKPGESLWGQYGGIKLVRVSNDAQIAYFVRDLPAGAPGDGQDPAKKPKEEELPKLAVGMSLEVWKAIHLVGGNAAPQGASPAANAPAGGVQWIDTDETVRKDNVWHIGRNDAAKFEQDNDEMLAGVGLDNYVSRFDSSVRGVRIVNVDSQLASKYGVAAGEVILAVNDTPVKTKSEAVNVGKKMYERGTRTFVIKFLNTSGQIIERTYQAPEKKN